MTEIPEDEVTAPWWDATRTRQLTVQRCDRCGLAQLPPRVLCTGCGAAASRLEAVAGRGVVDAYTVIHRAPDPAAEVPYTVARVRLAEGPILLTALVGVAEPRCDLPVTLAWRPLPDGRALPVFTTEE